MTQTNGRVFALAPGGVRTRDRVLFEHARIRGLLSDSESAATLARNGAHLWEDRLRRGVRELVQFFFAHVELEDTELMPLLIAAKGRAAGAALRRDHDAQRAALRALADMERQGNLQDLIRTTFNIARTLRDDMQHEEQELRRWAVQPPMEVPPQAMLPARPTAPR